MALTQFRLLNDYHREFLQKKFTDKDAEDQTLLRRQHAPRAERLNDCWPNVALVDLDELFEFLQQASGVDFDRGRGEGPKIIDQFGVVVDVVGEYLEDVGGEIPILLLVFSRVVFLPFLT